MKDLKGVSSVRVGVCGNVTVELKVFTLPSCPTCPMAKSIASETAQKLGVAYREVSLASQEGLREGLAYDIMCTPSIVLGDEVIVRGRLIAREKLEDEIRKRLEKWRERASTDKPV